MKIAYLYLVGGPLDGTYLPANPKLEGLPTEIAIYARTCGWHAYADVDAGGVAKVDVYKIIQTSNLFSQRPVNGTLHEMQYRGVLDPKQAEDMERMVRRRKNE